MIDRLDITDGFSVKRVFILNTVIFIDAALNISLRKFSKCNVLWCYLFGQEVPNETKGMINLKTSPMKDVHAFPEFTGYYHRFIKNDACIARPLNDLLAGNYKK